VARPHCSGDRLRALATGVERTADEVGRAFPGTRIVLARPGRDAPEVDPGGLVLATPGTEPEVPGGYAAALLLDGAALLARASLRAGEEALRRWLAAAALVRPAADGGVVVLVADPQLPAFKALVRGDAAGFAERELAERAALGLPPAVVLAEVAGPADAVRSYAARLELPDTAEMLGPVGVDGAAPSAEPAVRLLVRAPHEAGTVLASALHAASAARSARRETPPVRVRIDPVDLT
jgi:primosomal protein N' (replication factor Y)